VLNNIDSAKRSGILLDLVRHLDQNPYYKVSTKPPNEKIVEAFLEDIRLRTENLLSKLKSEKRTNKKNQLVQAILAPRELAAPSTTPKKVILLTVKKACLDTLMWSP
jgi:formyltetrahydrofolate hydrolase